MNKKDSYKIYTLVFDFILRMGLSSLPTPFEKICDELNIELVPLSKIIQNGRFTEKQVFEVWGNENGHLMPWKRHDGSYIFKIAYNNNEDHKDRKWFTIAEELGHYILKHYEHKMYAVFNPDPWNDLVYNFHEVSARTAAGILVCPPPLFYEIRGFLNSSYIQSFCDVSKSCADARYDIMTKFSNEIKNHHLYERVLENYRPYIHTVPCPICWEPKIIPNLGICYACMRGMYGSLERFAYLNKLNYNELIAQRG